MATRLPLLRSLPDPRARLWRSFFGRPSGPIGRVGARVMPFVSARLETLMMTELQLRPDDDVLDVGCGSGGFLVRAAEHAGYVAGLDASEIQLGRARQRLWDRLARGTGELVLGDAEKLPWHDGRFSVIASLNCLKFVADPDRALAEMCRVLRPGGRAALLIDPDVPDSASGTIDAFGQWRWSAHDAQLMMEKAGFGDVAVRQLPPTCYRLQLVTATKPVLPT